MELTLKLVLLLFTYVLACTANTVIINFSNNQITDKIVEFYQIKTISTFEERFSSLRVNYTNEGKPQDGLLLASILIVGSP